ncbi:hypothetical protein Agub_g2055, partial [Astrephomene gubernaculifera]
RDLSLQPRVRACVADIVECERALRRADALGVVSSCRSSLALAAHDAVAASRPRGVDLLDSLDDPGTPFAESAEMPASAVGEVAFCVSWLACMWGRAALAGIHPQVSLELAELWSSRMGKPATLQDFADIHQSFQELDMYGIEELLWKER